MTDKRQVDVEIDLVNSREVTEETKRIATGIGKVVGEIERGEDGLNKFERAIINAVGKNSQQMLANLRQQFAATRQEAEATAAALRNLGEFRRGIGMLRSGGALTQTDLAAVQGVKAQIRNDGARNALDIEKELNKTYEARYQLFKRAAAQLGDNNPLRGVRGADEEIWTGGISGRDSLHNARAMNAAMSLNMPEKVRNDAGRAEIGAEFRAFQSQVESFRQRYIREALQAEQAFYDERRKYRREDQQVITRSLAQQRQDALRREVADLKAQMPGIMSYNTPGERRAAFDAAQQAALARSGNKVSPRFLTPAFEETFARGELGLNARATAASNRAAGTTGIAGADKSILSTLDRFDAMGGAGIFAIQGKLMANYAAMTGVLSSVGFLTRFSVEFEQSMAQVQAISASTNTEMKSLEGTILSVAKNSRYAATEVADAAALMAQAGLSAQDIAKALPAITQLAIGTGTGLADTVDIVTSVLSVFQLQTGEAAQVANVLTAAMNRSKLAINQFQLGVQYAGNTAAENGISYNELAAALGGMANAGIKAGSTLGTGLRQLLVDLQAPTKNAKAVFAELGLSVSDLDVRSQGLFGVLRNLRDAGFDSADAFEAFEVRAAAAYTALTNDLPSVQKLNSEILNTASASDAAAIQMDTLSSRTIQFQNAIGAAVYKMSAPLRAIIESLLGGLTQVAGVLETFAPLFQAAFSVGVGALMGYVVQQVIQLAVGLAKLPGLLASMRAQSQQAAVANAALATSTTAAAAATTALGNASKTMLFVGIGSGIGALIGVISALAAGWDLLSHSMGWAGESMDAVNGRLNETRNQMASTQQELDAVRDMIGRVNDRANNLTEGSESLKEMTGEVTARFAEFGLQMKSNVTGAQDLISALVDLEHQLLAVQRLQLEKERSDTKSAVQVGGDKLRRDQITNPLNSGTLFSTPLNGLTSDERAQINALRRDRGVTAGLSAEKSANQLITQFTGASRLRNQFQNEATTGQGNPERLRTLNAMVKFLDGILVELADPVSNARDLLKKVDRLEQIDPDLTRLGIVEGEQYSRAKTAAMQVSAAMNKSRNAITDKGLPLVDQITLMRNDAASYRETVNQLMQVRGDIIRDYAQGLGITLKEAEAEFNKTELARILTEVKQFQEGNFRTKDGDEKDKDLQRAIRDAAKESVDQILTVSKGKRRPTYEEAEAILLRESKQYEEAARALLALEVDKNDTYADGTMGGQAMERNMLGDMALETNTETWLEQLRQNYDMGPRGAKGGGGKRFDQDLELAARKIKAIERRMAEVKGSVDSRSAPDEIVDAIDLYAALQDSWAEWKRKELGLKYDKAKWEDPGKAEALRVDLEETFEEELAATIAAGDVKMQELLRDVRNKLKQRGFEAEQKGLEQSLNAYLAGLQIFTQDQLDMAIMEINSRLEAIAAKAGEAFDSDPANAGRLSNPFVQADRRDTINGVLQNRMANFGSALSAYDRGAPKAANDRARSLGLERDEQRSRLETYGLPTAGLYALDKSYGRAMVSASGESLQASMTVHNELLKERARLEAKLAEASGEARLQIQRDLDLTNAAEREAAEAVQDRAEAYRKVKIEFYDMNQDIWSASKIIDLTLDGMFNGLTAGLGGVIDTAITDINDLGDAFDELGLNILQSLKTMAVRILTEQLIMFVLSLFGGGAGAPGINPNGAGAGVGTVVTPKRSAVGGANINRDSQLTLVQPGEGVLRKSAMDVVGREQFNNMNAQGNRYISQTRELGQERAKPRDPDMVNVYLVPKDQVPMPTKKDIVMAIAEDISTNGTTKKLIKQVAMGHQ